MPRNDASPTLITAARVAFATAFASVAFATAFASVAFATAFASVALAATFATVAEAQNASQPLTNRANQTTGQPSALSDDVSVTPDSNGFFNGFWRRPTLLGDMGGLRNVLGQAGVTVQLNEISEVLGNATGGLKQGATYDGLTTLTVQMDTQKAFHWEGGLINVSVLQIHGRNLSQYYLDNLQTASGIEASPTTRFWEIWYQQSFLDGRADIKIGQQSLDQEFITSLGSALFVNTMMGWPMVPSADLYAGGPAYPLSSLGVRGRVQLPGGFTALAGVFQDNPPGGPFSDDSQLRGSTRFGANFNLRTGALFIAEVQYALNQPTTGEMEEPGTHRGLPGTYKLGGWYDTASFQDQRYDSTGLSLSDPNSTGIPGSRHGNWSIYGVADQVVWQPDPNEPQVIGVFARVMGAPGDRNLIDFSVNAGVTLKGLIPGRDSDTIGVGYGIAKVGSSVQSADRAAVAFGGGYMPIRSSESFVELTYQAQITPWLQVQPDFQYVFMPGGGIVDPNRPDRRIRNEAVFGIRTAITF